MSIVKDFVDAVGRTPLIRLRRASEETGCEILTPTSKDLRIV